MAEDKDTERQARSRAAVAEEAPPEPPKPGEIVRTDGGVDERTDILGGGIKETLNIPVTAAPKDRTRQQRLMIRAAKTKVVKALGPIERPLAEWGLVGENDEVVGHFILVDLDTGDKVEVVDRLKIEGDKIYANAQQLNKALMKGEALKELL
jgi:multidrug efflux pump subunit AcrA (membrane-fusion protein)